MPDRPVPTLVIVGGFLGAGKTTFVLRAATLLRDRGMRVAVITNDQDAGLVDTMLSRAEVLETREVGGGCFCCKFSDLTAALDDLSRFAPEVIFAEPVGSCIDLSATILQPVKTLYSGRYRAAPLTVLVDPYLARAVLAGSENEDVAYLFRKQIAEADIICVSKSDRPDAGSDLPWPVDYRVSAFTGAGVNEWLTDVLTGSRIAGATLLDVDYDRYAEAEAALGWVNIHAEVVLQRALPPALVIGPLMDGIEDQLSQAGIRIAHLKALDRCASGYVKVSLCGSGEEPQPEGDLMASPDFCHEVVVNLRAIGDPEELQRIVLSVLTDTNGKISVLHQRAFRPSPPKPEHRFAEVIEGTQTG